MSKQLKKVPEKLLLDYLVTIMNIQFARQQCREIYANLDKKRQSIHQEILKNANIDRSNKEFCNDLAEWVENRLKRMRHY